MVFPSTLSHLALLLPPLFPFLFSIISPSLPPSPLSDLSLPHSPFSPTSPPFQPSYLSFPCTPFSPPSLPHISRFSALLSLILLPLLSLLPSLISLLSLFSFLSHLSFLCPPPPPISLILLSLPSPFLCLSPLSFLSSLCLLMHTSILSFSVSLYPYLFLHYFLDLYSHPLDISLYSTSQCKPLFTLSIFIQSIDTPTIFDVELKLICIDFCRGEQGNIVHSPRYVTSGYRSGQDREKPPGNLPFLTLTHIHYLWLSYMRVRCSVLPTGQLADGRLYGRCSHGGIYDDLVGGINSESFSYLLSPKHFLHEKSAQSALSGSLYYLNSHGKVRVHT